MGDLAYLQTSAAASAFYSGIRSYIAPRGDQQGGILAALRAVTGLATLIVGPHFRLRNLSCLSATNENFAANGTRKLKADEAERNSMRAVPNAWELRGAPEDRDTHAAEARGRQTGNFGRMTRGKIMFFFFFQTGRYVRYVTFPLGRGT